MSKTEKFSLVGLIFNAAWMPLAQEDIKLTAINFILIIIFALSFWLHEKTDNAN